MILRRTFAVALLCVALPLAAEDVETPAGVLALPEGFRLLTPDGVESAGGRLYLFGRESEVVPRSVFTLTIAPLPAGTPVDASVVAAQLADPTMLTPDGRRARRVKVGGIAGRRHSTTLSNRMVSTAWAVDHDGRRMIVQIKFPGTADYRPDAARFEQALRAFRWNVPQAEVAVGAVEIAPDVPEAVEAPVEPVAPADVPEAAEAPVKPGAPVAPADVAATADAPPPAPAEVAPTEIAEDPTTDADETVAPTPAETVDAAPSVAEPQPSPAPAPAPEAEPAAGSDADAATEDDTDASDLPSDSEGEGEGEPVR